MKNRFACSGIAVTVAILAGCAEQPTTPAPIEALPSFAAAASACAASPDYVVTDEAGLRAALDAAEGGDVVAVEGRVEVTENVVIEREGVTLTCATPGAGLVASAGAPVWGVVLAAAPNVLVRGLEIDASATGAYALYAVGTAEDLRFVGNRVRCGGGCTFGVGAQRTVISDNHFEAEYASTGIHMQGTYNPDRSVFSPTDGARIERNTLVALREIGHHLFGAIRPRDGRGIIVADNVVRGPWSNGIGVAEMTDSRIERNVVEGSRQYGIFISSNPFQPVSTTNSLFRANRVSAGEAPIFARRACGNVISGNTFPRSSAEWPMVFHETTGANAFLGKGAVVLDNGALDCDGDGTADPNVITGAAGVEKGHTLGEIVSEVLPTVAGQEIR